MADLIKPAKELRSSTPKQTKRNLSLSSNESIVAESKRRSTHISSVDEVDEIDVDDENYSSAEDTTSVDDGHSPVPQRKSAPDPVRVDWSEMLDAMTTAFKDLNSPFCKGLSQVIDTSEKLNHAHERLNQFKSKIAEQDHRIYEMSNELSALKTSVASKDDEIDELRADIDELKNGMKTINEKQEQYESENVSNRLDELDQYGRRNMLRLSGIAEPGENASENVTALVIDFFQSKLDVEVLRSDIDRTHRLGPYDNKAKNPRSIIVKFTNFSARNRVFSARRKLFKSGLYMNDHLTSTRARLMFIARQYKKKNLITNVWSSEGRVLVRNKADSQTYAISSLADLVKFDPKGEYTIPDEKKPRSVNSAP